MASKLQVFTRRIFLLLHIVLVICLLISSLVPYLNPRTWWFVSFFGLAFPIFLFLVIIFGLAWLIVLKPRYALISGVALLLSFKSISVFFAFHPGASFKSDKEKGAVRVVSWNVARFLELKRNTNEKSQLRLKMLELLRQQEADVLCLQEFHTSTNPDYYNNIETIQKELGYPYFYFSFDEDGDLHYYSSIIFSRFPIIDTGKIRYPRPTLPDALIHADILAGKDTLRIYTTHLQSLQFGKKDYDRISRITTADDSLVSNSRNVLSKIRRGFMHRSLQADLIAEVVDDSPYPVVFCADLNDIPNSYTYFKVRGGMQDAFLKKGFGVGRTFSSLSPTLRIDYIFADDKIRILQMNRVLKRYSDHYMLVADIQPRK